MTSFKKSQKPKIGFLGAGNMAQALIAGLLKQKVPCKNILATDLDLKKLKDLQTKTGIVIAPSNQALVESVDYLVFAIKPQDFDQTAQALSFPHSKPVFVSIMAGVKTQRIARQVGKDALILRTMPNQPALVGAGMTGLFTQSKLSPKTREQLEGLFLGVGSIVWVKKEEELDAVTGLSGSGPAYVYRFIQALSEAGKKQGLSEKTAYALSLETVLGAAQTLKITGQTPKKMIPLVTSKGGTTFAGLTALDDMDFDDIISETVKRATERAREL